MKIRLQIFILLLGLPLFMARARTTSNIYLSSQEVQTVDSSNVVESSEEVDELKENALIQEDISSEEGSRKENNMSVESKENTSYEEDVSSDETSHKETNLSIETKDNTPIEEDISSEEASQKETNIFIETTDGTQIEDDISSKEASRKEKNTSAETKFNTPVEEDIQSEVTNNKENTASSVMKENTSLKEDTLSTEAISMRKSLLSESTTESEYHGISDDEVSLAAEHYESNVSYSNVDEAQEAQEYFGDYQDRVIEKAQNGFNSIFDSLGSLISSDVANGEVPESTDDSWSWVNDYSSTDTTYDDYEDEMDIIDSLQLKHEPNETLCVEDELTLHCPMENVDHLCYPDHKLNPRIINVGYCKKWNPANNVEVRETYMSCTACCNIEEEEQFSIPSCQNAVEELTKIRQSMENTIGGDITPAEEEADIDDSLLYAGEDEDLNNYEGSGAVTETDLGITTESNSEKENKDDLQQIDSNDIRDILKEAETEVSDNVFMSAVEVASCSGEDEHLATNEKLYALDNTQEKVTDLIEELAEEVHENQDSV